MRINVEKQEGRQILAVLQQLPEVSTFTKDLDKLDKLIDNLTDPDWADLVTELRDHLSFVASYIETIRDQCKALGILK